MQLTKTVWEKTLKKLLKRNLVEESHSSAAKLNTETDI